MDPNRYKQKSKLELPFHDGKLWLKRNVCKLMPKCPAFCWTGTSDVKVTNEKKKICLFLHKLDWLLYFVSSWKRVGETTSWSVSKSVSFTSCLQSQPVMENGLIRVALRRGQRSGVVCVCVCVCVWMDVFLAQSRAKLGQWFTFSEAP